MNKLHKAIKEKEKSGGKEETEKLFTQNII